MLTTQMEAISKLGIGPGLNMRKTLPTTPPTTHTSGSATWSSIVMILSGRYFSDQATHHPEATTDTPERSKEQKVVIPHTEDILSEQPISMVGLES